MGQTLVTLDWTPTLESVIVALEATMNGKMRWSDLSPGQQTAIAVGAAVQVALATAAWVDLATRPPEQVRGPKAAWALGIAVNFVGPISYFAVGRRRHGLPAR